MNMNKAQRNLLVIMAVIILISGIEWLSHGQHCIGSLGTNLTSQLGISGCLKGRDIEKLIGELLTIIPSGLLIYFAVGYKKIEKKGKNENET